MRKIKILLYGDIIMNIIDGSSVWVTSILNVLSINENLELTFLLKTPIERRELIDSIQHLERINLIEPNGFSKDEYSFSPCEALNAIKKLDDKNHYDIILIRGIRICKLVSKWETIKEKSMLYVTEIESNTNNVTSDDICTIKKIIDNCKVFFVQTPEAKARLINLLNLQNKEKIIYMQPMISDFSEILPDYQNKNNTLVYSGKFSSSWYTNEWLQGFIEAYKINHSINLKIVGDKFNDDLDVDYIKTLFETHPNINWLKGVSHNESTKVIVESDIGIAWRSPLIDNDDSIEISTKILEYARAGKPILVRRTKMYTALLGESYPLFTDTKEDFIINILRVCADPVLYEKSARMAYKAVKQYTYKERYKYLHPFIKKTVGLKTNILFTGHDLKFIQQFIDYCCSIDTYNVRIDKWQSHDLHDEFESIDCLEWADIIFCEWGLGNTVWYSQHKKVYQKLYVRIHLQERETDYSNFYNFGNIDKFFIISPYMFEEFAYKINIPKEKMMIVYTWVDCDLYDKPKTEDAKYNLGIVGICPRRKRFDLIIDLLEYLLERDNRYHLFVKGKHPSEYLWIWENKNERMFYENQFKRLDKEHLKGKVTFDGYSSNMDVWFTKIGYILSPSDFEGTHVSVAEGMASGAVPVIRDREDVYSVYGYDYICHNVAEAVEYIIRNADNVGSEEYKKYSRKNFNSYDIFKKLLFYIEQ